MDKTRQAVNTLLSLPLANFVAERIDVGTAETVSALMVPLLSGFGLEVSKVSSNHAELGLTLLIAAGVVSPALEGGRALLLDATSGRAKRFHKWLGGA